MRAPPREPIAKCRKPPGDSSPGPMRSIAGADLPPPALFSSRLSAWLMIRGAIRLRKHVVVPPCYITSAPLGVVVSTDISQLEAQQLKLQCHMLRGSAMRDQTSVYWIKPPSLSSPEGRFGDPEKYASQARRRCSQPG